jgi:type II secretory pathway predicted ATPase ExeA
MPKVHKQISSWGTRLNEWRQQDSIDLSIRDVAAKICDGRVGKSTIGLICKGQHDTRVERLVKPMIAEGIRAFLREKGRAEIEIERDLCAIFNERNYQEDIKPVLTQRVKLSKEAVEFFKLRCDPFTTDPRDRSEVFMTPRLTAILGHLIEAVKFQGFAAAIGEVGSGKTILKRMLVGETNGKLRVLWPEFMNMEKVHSGSIAAFILRSFGQPSPHDLVYRADRLKKVLGGLADDGIRVALGFDECHRLHPNLLTALKNFWELGSGGFDRYLGLVLFGQTRFEHTLQLPEFREITERLDIIRVPSLGKSASEYLAHRTKIAGRKLDELFEPAALTRLTKLADTPLALGNVANAGLLKAYSVSQKRVIAAMIPESNRDPQVRGIRSAQN